MNKMACISVVLKSTSIRLHIYQFKGRQSTKSPRPEGAPELHKQGNIEPRRY